MAGGCQRTNTYRTSSRAGHASSGRGRQHPCLLLEQRQTRSHALAIFGSLVRQRFVNSALFKLAGSFLKRMKQYFQSGWQHVPRPGLGSVSTSAPTRACGEGMAGRATCSKRSRHKQLDKQKCGKSRRSGAKCQRSKKMSSRLKKNAAQGADDKIVQSELTEMVDQPSVGTCAEGTKQHTLCQTHRMNSAQCANVAELSATENVFGVSQSQNAPLFVNGINNRTKRQKKRKRSTRLKYKALTDVTEAYTKKNARTTRPETKPLLHQQISKSRRTRHESERPVALSNPEERQSHPGFIASQENNNDWPSLAEVGRAKGLTKEAARKVIERKYAGPGGRDACNMLAYVTNVESRCSGANMDEKESRSWTVHQQCASTSSQRTWASVAAQSSTGSMRRASQHGASDNHQTCTQVKVESTPAANSCRLTIRKPPIRSKLAYSLRFAGDHSMIKEKPTSSKFMTERQESTKFLKTMRCKNKIAKRFGQKDIPVVLGAVHEKRKQRKGERFDKMHDNVGHLPITHKPKSCWKHNWKADEMPTVCACSTPPVLSKQAVSKSDNRREPQLSATERFHKTTNVAVAADSIGKNIDANSGLPINTRLLSYNALSDIRDVQQDVAVAASFSNASCFKIKTEFQAPVESEISVANVTEIQAAGESSILPASFQTEMPSPVETEMTSPVETEMPIPTKTELAAPVDTENRSPKKVSLRYRALLRGDCSHVGAKTLTEMQTRNKKTNHLHDSKVATRERQRQQRQERQTSHHDALRFHASTRAEEHSQDYEPGFASGRFQYWLRSMHGRESIKGGTLGDTQSNGETDEEAGSLGVTNTATIQFANLTPCRKSERLRAKPRKVWPSYLR